MHFFAALATIEQILLNIITDGEQRAAGSVRGCVHSVGAGNTPGDGTYGSVGKALECVWSRGGYLTLGDVESESKGNSSDKLFEGHDRCDDNWVEDCSVLGSYEEYEPHFLY